MHYSTDKNPRLYTAVIERGTVLYFQDVIKPSIKVGGWELEGLLFGDTYSKAFTGDVICVDHGQDWNINGMRNLMTELRKHITPESLKAQKDQYKQYPTMY